MLESVLVEKQVAKPSENVLRPLKSIPESRRKIV
jgi:hypothetical protein